MREMFEICQKNTVFNFFGAFLALRGVNLVRKGVKQCSDVSRTTWENCLLTGSEKMTIFLHLALCFHLSLPKMWHPTHFKITFLKSTRIELSLHKVLF